MKTSRVSMFVAAACVGVVTMECQSLLSAEPPADAAPSPPLVRREQVQLTLAGAQRAVEAAQQKADEIGVAVNISVVDDGGHLLAFARMDGARPGSVYTSITKATAAATKRGPTGPLRPDDPAGTQLSLAVENAAAVSGGKFTSLKGGIPIVVDDQVIGAVGVGGATGEQDAEVSSAGVAALTAAIGAQASVSAADVPKELMGHWLVEDINGKGVIDNAQTTLDVHANSTVSGNTGLNRFMSQASIDGKKVTFSHAVMTRRGGPPALMDQESKFVAALEDVASYSVDANGLLQLKNADGQTLLRCSPMKADGK